MAYYLEDQLTGPVIGERRPTINEYFLSSYTMSIYDGCEFGCTYCDGWAYRMRPFNETVRIGVDLPERVAAELEQIDRGDLIGITALTDPYQPAENSYRFTRQVLSMFAERGQPCLILTKSPTVLEDMVLLEQINAKSLAIVMFTILTTDAYLSSKLEDKAPAPSLRLDAIRELKRAKIPVGVAMMPVLPYVNDTNLIINSTLHAVAEAGADFVVWDYLHIPSERHRARINDLLQRTGRYPPSYYRDLYRASADGSSLAMAALPQPTYRAERSQALLERCDALQLPIRAPHELFAGKLKPANEAALLLKHAAARDAIQGRQNIASLGVSLANDVYNNRIDDKALHQSPMYPTIRAILDGTTE